MYFSYCTACPPGTYNSLYGATSVQGCVPCPPGKYCQGQGNILPTGKCFSGYFCNGSSTTPTEFTTPPGYFSPNGSSAAVACLPGTYNGNFAQGSCRPCPAGFSCAKSGTTSYSSLLCPTGHYCPLHNVAPVPCPAGTFSNTTGNGDLSACVPCTPGSYCSGPALRGPTGLCAAGYKLSIN